MYSDVLELDLSTVKSSAGPSRPHDRVDIARVGNRFNEACSQRGVAEKTVSVNIDGSEYELSHGAVAIAAVTSCTTATDPDDDRMRLDGS